MSSDPHIEARNSNSQQAERESGAEPSAEAKLASLDHMLGALEEPTPSPRASNETAHENRLVQVRLGIASGLFMALRAKHSPTAMHSLRVALGCSSWAVSLGMEDDQRDALEVAALLHDVGKIGVSDPVLLKPGELTEAEFEILSARAEHSCSILKACCCSQDILDIVKYCSAWFDGSKPEFDRSGQDLPLGARMLAIADAFDAMTTEQVYRRAMSRDWALGELFACAGTQFDPELVESFNALQTGQQSQLHAGVMRHWLQELSPDGANDPWRLGQPIPTVTASEETTLFHERFLDNMHDGVVYVDATLKILRWNHAAERLTGLRGTAVLEKRWTPSLVKLTDLRGRALEDGDCPIRMSLKTGTQTLRRLMMQTEGGKQITVDTHVVPVVDASGTVRGAAMLLHDASSESSLEQRVESLHVRATRDPLTKVANRAEFDRALIRMTKEHLEKKTPFSLIICDLDHFKSINDKYGHQAGDEALIGFAALLSRLCRQGDLAARYGGEEFVMLCPDCDNSNATLRAEEVRREWAAMSQPSLGGKHITASFGVTEIQQGDTPESVLRRADRGLLQAKEFGRNTVVQLGSGLHDDDTETRNGWFTVLWNQKQNEVLLERHLVTAVPMKVAVEKLRGFVADHHAHVVSITEDRVMLRVEGNNMPFLRRKGDRAVPLLIEVDFVEKHLGQAPASVGDSGLIRTVMRVVIRPKRSRDRRRRDATERARQLLVSMKSYLMAHEYGSVSGKAAGEQGETSGEA